MGDFFNTFRNSRKEMDFFFFFYAEREQCEKVAKFCPKKGQNRTIRNFSGCGIAQVKSPVVFLFHAFLREVTGVAQAVFPSALLPADSCWCDTANGVFFSLLASLGTFPALGHITTRAWHGTCSPPTLPGCETHYSPSCSNSKFPLMLHMSSPFWCQ